MMSFGIESEARGRFPLFILIRIVKPAIGELSKQVHFPNQLRIGSFCHLLYPRTQRIEGYCVELHVSVLQNIIHLLLEQIHMIA